MTKQSRNLCECVLFTVILVVLLINFFSPKFRHLIPPYVRVKKAWGMLRKKFHLGFKQNLAQARFKLLPLFFVGGATIEYAMIHWKPNGINFYERFKRKKVKEVAMRKYKMLGDLKEFV